MLLSSFPFFLNFEVQPLNWFWPFSFSRALVKRPNIAMLTTFQNSLIS